MQAIALRLEAISIRLEAIALRVQAISLREAIPIRLEAIAIGLEAIIIRLEAIAITLCLNCARSRKLELLFDRSWRRDTFFFFQDMGSLFGHFFFACSSFCLLSFFLWTCFGETGGHIWMLCHNIVSELKDQALKPI